MPQTQIFDEFVRGESWYYRRFIYSDYDARPLSYPDIFEYIFR